MMQSLGIGKGKKEIGTWGVKGTQIPQKLDVMISGPSRATVRVKVCNLKC